jgi:hypothetical protein
MILNDSEINKLRDFIMPSGALIKQRINRTTFSKKFPILYQKIKGMNNEEYKENLYNILYNSQFVYCPCGKKTRLKNFKEGYRRYCSNKCCNLYQEHTEDTSRKISDYKKEKFSEEYYKNKLGFKAVSQGNCWKITPDCGHDDFTINKGKAKRYLEKGISLCPACHKESIDILVVDFDTNREEIKNIPASLTEDQIYHLYPLIYKSIKEWPGNKSILSFSEARYRFISAIEKAPICPICKERECTFSFSTNKYNNTCCGYSCLISKSTTEIELLDFISSIYKGEIIKSYRDTFEIDVYLPELKTGFEFNGEYWHSYGIRGKKYHVDKNLYFFNKGIKVYTIWESDWLNKKSIIESIIFSKINSGLHKRIHGRKTEVKVISSREAYRFSSENHLQGGCNSSISYGLFYENELVAIMSFGEKRHIIGGIKGNSSYELLRYCVKIGLSIPGGASKLFKKFILDYSPLEIISYAKGEISYGGLYYALGFNKISDKIQPGFFWFKGGRKFHRSHSLKFKEDGISQDEYMAKNGFIKVYDCGSYKFIWKRER